MARKMKKGTIIYLVSSLILALGGCSEDILTEAPPHIMTAETIYTTPDGFEAGLNGLYALARREREGLTSQSTLIATLMMTGTDNVFSNSKSAMAEPSYNWLLNNPNARGYSDIFLWLYKTINAANTIIGRAGDPAVELCDPRRYRRSGASFRRSDHSRGSQRQTLRDQPRGRPDLEQLAPRSHPLSSGTRG